MFAVTLSKEEMATAVAGMQFWAQEVERYAAMTDGAIAEHNRAEAKRIRKIAADLSFQWFDAEYKRRKLTAAERESAAAAVRQSQAAPITPDDLHEFGCWLEMAGENEDAMRSDLANLLNTMKDSKYTRQAMAEIVGFCVLDLVQNNRAYLAEQKFWEEV